jgi:alanine racemase
MSSINSTAWLEVDLDKMAHNLREVKKVIGDKTKICAVIKADGYKLGSVKCAEIYIESGAEMVAVAVLDEAMEIRNKLPEASILVLGHTPEELYPLAIKNNIIMTIYDYKHGYDLNKACEELDKKADIHIKIETGMNRLGFLPCDKSLKAIVELSKMPYLNIAGIYSHLANADAEDKSSCYEQKKRFDDFINVLSEKGVNTSFRHISNSAAIIDLPDFNYEMVRPGIILTGIYPSNSENNKKLDLQMAFKLKAKLTHIKTVQREEGVSYGHRFKADRATKVGTIPIGYADGFSRALTGKMEVSVKGIRCKLIGSICMDQCMVDLTDVKNVNTGDEVVIYDDGTFNGLHPDEVAERIGTINHEILTMLDRRLPRIYFKSGEMIAVKNYLL